MYIFRWREKPRRKAEKQASDEDMKQRNAKCAE